MRDIRNIVILTGAGISAESGLQTFRAADGLWEGHRVEDVATPEAFARNPALVHQFYDARRARLGEVEPNAAHVALARLDAEWPGELLIVTQNVDDLHERAGAKRLLHMHGEVQQGLVPGVRRAVCVGGPMSPAVRPEPVEGRFARSRTVLRQAQVRAEMLPVCETVGMVRPDIVWFGEMPYEMERIEAALMRADLFVSIGTSGAVYPAAGFVQTAQVLRGARRWRSTSSRARGALFFDERRYGRASELVPSGWRRCWLASLREGRSVERLPLGQRSGLAGARRSLTRSSPARCPCRGRGPRPTWG